MVLFRTFRPAMVLAAASKVVPESVSLLRPHCPTTQTTGAPANQDLSRLLSRRDPLPSGVALASRARTEAHQGLQIPRRRGPSAASSSPAPRQSHPAGLAACADAVRWALPEIPRVLLKKVIGGGLLLLARVHLVCVPSNLTTYTFRCNPS